MTSLSFTVLEIIECSLDKCKYPLMNFNCVVLINPIIRLLNIKEINLAIDLFVQKKSVCWLIHYRNQLMCNFLDW